MHTLSYIVLPREAMKEDAKKLAEMLKIPTQPLTAVKVKVEEIYNLGMAGKRVA